MGKITKIEASSTLAPEKKKVAAYCRVSTGSDEQLVSLETQKAHYESFIQANPEWEYAGLYYDEGVSGTKAETRSGLQQMLSDCNSGKINHVITKSISRFSRNTTDTLEIVRDLLSKGISIYFEKENINTAHMEGELLLSIMSSLAEDESASLSQNVKWGVNKRYKDGSFIIGYPPYGYKNVDGEMVIVPEEAAVVKRIFEMALSGEGSARIARTLNQQGVPTRRTGHWASKTVLGMLTNEKYVGDCLFQKSYTDSSYNRHVNRGEKNQYFMENHHEAIISREDFEQVRRVLEQRAKEKGNSGDKDRNRYLNRYVFSGKIKCGNCGATCKRRSHYTPSGNYIAWTCSTHISHRELCDMKYVTEESIKKAFVTMVGKLSFGYKEVLQPLMKKVSGFSDKDQLIKAKELENEIETNLDQRQVLKGLMARGLLEPPVYLQQMQELTAEGDRLQSEKTRLYSQIKGGFSKGTELKKLINFVSKHEAGDSFSDELFLEYVDHIEVLSREKVAFHLKCGLVLTERLVK